MLHLLWLIPLLPAAGFVLNGLVGRRLPRRLVAVVGCGVILAAFVVSLGAVLELGHLEGMASTESLSVDAPARRVTQTLYTW
ncbi:MAG: hypothetical protein V3U83_05525, partial [Acidobacteriota bacterium]